MGDGTALPRRLIAAVLGLALAGACVKSTGAPPPGGSTSPSAKPSINEVIVPVGRSALTASGNTVTVRTFLPNIGPAAGTDIYVAADVEACAGKHASAAVNRSLFAVETAGQTGWPSRDPVKQPALRSTYITPNHCTRGWVTFRVPNDQPVLFVVLLSSSVVKWKVT